MKVTYGEKHVLDTGGLKEAQAFKIRTSAHAFQILSSGLYSDKITAVLREIGCNAHDAHVEKGIAQRAFDVKLPNRLDNQFYIRDYGPGLSHDDVMNLYTTYFASTKQESNDFTGAFGLGSKSPFSYTDSFTVTACHGGRKRIYTAHIGDTGSPIVALMDESSVGKDWQTGIEVGFPVKPEDFTAFAEKAAKVFRWFNPLPKVVGSTVLLKPVKVEQEFGSYAFLDPNDDDFGEGICVQMGNVKYPVDKNELTLDQTAAVKKGKELDGLLLRFDLGKLQVAASREKLQYDPVTQRAISVKIGEVLISMAKEVHQAFLNANTWTKLCDFKKMRQDVSRGISLNEELFELAGIKNKQLCEACKHDYFMLPQRTTIVHAHYTIQQLETSSMGTRMRTIRPVGVGSRGYIEYDPNLIIVEGTEKQAMGRIRMALINKVLTGKIVLVVPNKKMKGTQQDVDMVLKLVCGAFKGVVVKSLEDFPAPLTISTHRRKKGSGLPPLPAEEVMLHGVLTKITDVNNTTYMLFKRSSSWGHARSKWLVDAATELDSHEQRTVFSRIDTINKLMPGMKIAYPAEITRFNARRFALGKRPEWVPFQAYLKDKLSDPENLKALKAQISKSVYTVELSRWYSDQSTSLLDNMVHMKEKLPTMFSKLVPILAKHDVLDSVVETHKFSKKPPPGGANEEPEVLAAYRHLAESMHITIETPEFHKATKNIDDKFTQAAKVEFRTWRVLDGHTPNLLPQFLDELLTRG